MSQKIALGELPDWPLLMTIEEASRYIGISVSLFRELKPVDKIRIRAKTFRYHRDDLKAWAQHVKQGTPSSPNDALIQGMFG